ncbi:MAG: type II secretion system F family protein [Vicinamibacterales bacterium]
MPPDVLITLGAVFVSVSMLCGAIAFLYFARSNVGRRLDSLTEPSMSGVIDVDAPILTGTPEPIADRIVSLLPTSRGSVARLRREMALAGYYSASTAALFSVTEIVLPLVLGALAYWYLPSVNLWIRIALGGMAGYMAPGFLLQRRIAKRKKEIQNGLADALDLFVLCLEAGTGLDQAIVKAGEELEVAYPALGDQLRMLIAEMRAGKPRLEAFRGLAARTQVDDVRALVAMLVQTDKFGTSIAQALRSHADVCRTKRRQRAEERAQKVGVKLVFPLVFCLFPALYVVMLGPAYLEFMKVFSGQ